MGQISFEQASQSMNTYSGNGPQVGFFALKNDGDEAVVRFLYDNTSQFDIFAVHPVQIEGRYGKVNCIRDARDPLDKCPMCNAGVKLENRFYIKMIQYDRDETTGNIIPTAKIWDRPISYATTLASYINEYGPLSECVFKIKRRGAAKSLDTRYDIMFASPQVYRPELYPKRADLFEGYNILGTAVRDKNFDELNAFLATGKFPAKPQNESVSNSIPDFPDPAPAASYNNQNVQPVPYPNPQFTPVQQTATYPNPSQQFAPVNNQAPWESTTPSINRPVRTY